ncbi:MAG: flavodoxin domain-containing protein [Clostridiaceae bacterium]
MKKCLIVYASKAGTTRDAANALAKPFGSACDRYDCIAGTLLDASGAAKKRPMRKMDLGGYDVIALGTAMYMGMPIKALSRFCAVHETSLLQKKLILFTCGIGTEQEDKPYLWQRLPASITNASVYYRHLGGEIRKGKGIPMANMILKEYAKTHASPPQIDSAAVEELVGFLSGLLAESAGTAL